MSSTTDSRWYLDRLGVDGHADERAIRRAYARELKLIDQAADPGGFQSLREAYEHSLAWVRMVNAVDEDVPIDVAPPAAWAARPATAIDPVVDAPPPPPPPARPSSSDAADPYELASAVIADLINALAEPIRRADRAVPALLERARTDPRLTSVDARHLFEGILVAGLAAGWRPHHEHLFTAAVDQFDWRADRARLRGYHGEGALIDAAIEQHEAFLDQDWLRRRRQLKAIARLRSEKPPSRRYLLKQLPLLEALEAAWPHWLHVVASEPTLRAWGTQAAAIPRWRRILTYKSSDKSRMPRSARSRRDWWIMAIGLSIGVLWGLMKWAMH
ncbi:hypothetical protein BH09PSE6_BH09PSE6_02030 [soil metagenome]